MIKSFTKFFFLFKIFKFQFIIIYEVWLKNTVNEFL